MATTVQRWDREADVVVVGTGGAALTAAILADDNGAKVLVMERSDKVGGTTAISGGGFWIPLNHHMAEVEVQDSREEALVYCKRLTAGRAPDELVEAFVDTAHQMVRYLEQHTPVKCSPVTMPDYHAELPGGKLGGRTLETELFDKKELGEWASKLRVGPTSPIPITLEESFTKYRPMITPQDLPMDLIVGRMDKGLVSSGNALIGRLLKGCLDRGIAILLETRGRQLIMEDGRVAGLRAERDGKDFFVKAPAVVLACGGFEWNERLMAQFMAGPMARPITGTCSPTCSPPHCNEGDGLIMAMEAGADLANMSEGWLCPGAYLPGEEYEGEPAWTNVHMDRSLPHAILVNRHGRRFVDEAANYNDIGKAFQHFDPRAYEYPNSPAWLIIDSQYRQKYTFLRGTIMPGDPDPEWLLKDDTLAGLARKVGINPQALEETVARWNGFVSEGKDADFHRGESPIESYFGGDHRMPNPNMGTIEKPPFYAQPLEVGFMGGTNGGPRTNPKGQVLNVRGEVIPGLYAAGNTMASVCGPAYYGGGATVGTGMTFGYICGVNAAKEARTGAK